MARGDGETSGFSPLVMIGGLVVVAGLAFGGAYLLLSGQSSDQLVVIKAPTTPVRVAPEDPGGLKLNSIDSPVMDLLVEQANQDEKNAEVLVPPVSEPELPPIDVDSPKDDPAAKDDAAPKDNPAKDNTPVDNTPVLEAITAAQDNASPPAETSTQPSTVQAEPAQPKSSVDPANQDDQGDSAPVAAASAEPVVTETKAAKTDESPEQSQDEIADAISSLSSDQPVAKPKTPKIVNTTDNNAPSFVVQFAAFKSETRAKNTAAVLATKHASRLGEITLGYMKRDQYWRVVTEPMPRADATSLCRMFRSVGQDCITKLMEQPQ